MTTAYNGRPPGILALSLFFLVVAVISLVLGLSILHPGTFLEPMWRLNPSGHEALMDIGERAVVLFLLVAVLCAVTAMGLWWGRRWGYWLAVSVIAINLLGDFVNIVSGKQQRAIVGIPIAVVVMACLISRNVRLFFHRPIAR